MRWRQKFCIVVGLSPSDPRILANSRKNLARKCVTFFIWCILSCESHIMSHRFSGAHLALQQTSNGPCFITISSMALSAVDRFGVKRLGVRVAIEINRWLTLRQNQAGKTTWKRIPASVTRLQKLHRGQTKDDFIHNLVTRPDLKSRTPSCLSKELTLLKTPLMPN